MQQAICKTQKDLEAIKFSLTFFSISYAAYFYDIIEKYLLMRTRKSTKN